MATKARSDTKTQEKTPTNLSTIEELREKYNISLSVFAGVKNYKGWGEGKRITENEFLKAVKGFTQGPINKKGVK